MPGLLGLDMGEKRIGVSVTDESGSLATPLTALEFRGRKKLLEALTQFVDQYHISKIVVGLPKTMKGEIGPAATKVTELVEWLKGYIDKPWILWDERLSTQEIERILLAADMSRARRKEVRDQLAAQRILQSYVDASKKM